MSELSIEEYEEIARKILNASFPNVCSDILKNVDKFDEIVHAIMVADWKYDESRVSLYKGNASLYGYRKQRVLWAVKKLYGPQPKKALSLHHTNSKDEDLLDTISYAKEFDIVEFNDVIDNLKERVTKSKVVTDKEKYCILEYLVNDKSLEDIASHFNIQKKSVLCNVRNGLTKLGIFNGDSERLRVGKNGGRKNKVDSRGNGI